MSRWIYSSRRPTASQGWKLYVSCTPRIYSAVRDAVISSCENHRLAFKYLADEEAIEAANFGIWGYSQVGKNFVIYDAVDCVEALLADLKRALTLYRYRSPRVPFARALGGGWPIYYRYGAYIGHQITLGNSSVADDRNRLATIPHDIVDPFNRHLEPELPLPSDWLLTYPVFETLNLRGRGGTYIALDLKADYFREVIVKTGLVHGGVLRSNIDGAELICRECRFYRAAERTALTEFLPLFIEFFDREGIKALILEKIDGTSLRYLRETGLLKIEIVRHGLEIIKTIHNLGLYWGDAKIDNMILSNSGHLKLIDFETAGPMDLQPTGLQTFRVAAINQDPLRSDLISYFLSILVGVSVSPSILRCGVDMNQIEKYDCDDDLQKWAKEGLLQTLS